MAIPAGAIGMKTLGLDISTYVGMAVVGDGQDRGKCVHFPKLKGFSRLQSIALEVSRVVEVWKPDFVIIEGYAYGNKGSLVTLVECGTVVRNVIFSKKLAWVEVPPSVLKKWTTGKGCATKESMAEAVRTRWGYQSPSDDIVDAYALAQMGQMGMETLAQMKEVRLGC
jgi:Holliday junction resolvasome RuvABC endonuclease subunit